ncbi:Glutamyl-tRNA(Gln) amidotransferase subunit A isoform 4 [Hibiscus syriacus]|uniref:Glutamyl-tRNA(Gln) amidotransferase subunit A isoform 4 n=1 Tax=Hibiscus syriacus TaxID=106335 RepID=A0A6A3BYX8_HIBSY|nr:glutamyl-tRNA(Gln) amidotransferase subunit A-like [Hibiscus syriacus]KAE8720202.1 Glutamyl-tRNA(Gln) amidotransferase subunit A isoform 4 [Hibiscus syriacus]
MATWFLDKCRNMSSRCSTRFMASLVSQLFFFLAVSCAYLPSESAVLLPSHRLLASSAHKEMDSENGSQCSKRITEASQIRPALPLLDADFLNDTKVLEIAKGAKEFNVPIIRANRKLVASVNGGLHNHSPLIFNPEWSTEQSQGKASRFNHPSPSGIQRPNNEEDIAFMSVLELGELIKNKQITSEELTGIFLKRLRRYNPVLESVVTNTEDLAYQQAKAADKLLSQGVYLGPLHGIPYGLKDIISVPHYKTTWGSKTFKNQVLNIDAWVYKRLKSAGAVLVAKLVSGSLAYDDIWFGGRTRNPWNIEEFSTGSSAGPAACTSAGMVPFAIGSETAGSITYPAARCGVTALRPTFGSVGRTGVMSISESLDKLGPFCRYAADCAIILDAIRGKDPDDSSSRDIPFGDPFSVDITKLTVGYLDDADMEVVHVLESKGVKAVPFKLKYTVDSVQGILNFTMDVDMLAHFDEWQRSGRDDDYEAQDQWPLELRRARVVSAVDYMQAQRARGKLIQEVKENFNVDAFIGNATDWERVCMGNLVGLPVTVIPTGFKNISNSPPTGTRRRTTVNTGIYAPPNHDHIALALAMAYQSATDHHKKRPPIDDLGPNDKIPNPSAVPIPPRSLHL